MGSLVAEIAERVASSSAGARSELEIRGGLVSPGTLLLSTAEPTVVDGNKLGQIDFQAPAHDGTGDALLVAASIYAEADGTFGSTVNATELVFATGASEAAAEKMRLTSDGKLGIGIATPASLLDVRGTVQVGVDDTGHDVVFYGATSGKYWMWDESLDKMTVTGIVGLENTLTVGVDDTGHDVKFFGASAGAFMLYDESADTLEIRGPSADASTSTGKLLLSTALTDINDGDVLGRIDFKAPLEAGGTDAILLAASIYAEADATFAADNNATELVFATGASEAATEKMRITSDGKIGIGSAAPSVALDVVGEIKSTGNQSRLVGVSFYNGNNDGNQVTLENNKTYDGIAVSLGTAGGAGSEDLLYSQFVVDGTGNISQTDKVSGSGFRWISGTNYVYVDEYQAYQGPHWGMVFERGATFDNS